MSCEHSQRHWTRALTGAAWVFVVLGCGGVQRGQSVPLDARALYPLAQGNSWSYDVDTGDKLPTLAMLQVRQRQGTEAEVRASAGNPLHYRVGAQGIWRIDKNAYLLKNPIRTGATWASGPDMQAKVEAMGLSVDTPAGRFQDCVEVHEQARSGQQIRTTYCPGVGPVRIDSTLHLPSAGRPVRAVGLLRAYRVQDAAKR
ncbi:MAG: hypothetical protein ACPGUV_12230 [Polyangiales bacterium]